MWDAMIDDWRLYQVGKGVLRQPTVCCCSLGFRLYQVGKGVLRQHISIVPLITLEIISSGKRGAETTFGGQVENLRMIISSGKRGAETTGQREAPPAWLIISSGKRGAETTI